ncbi:hypothetical protein BZK42_26845 [Citrobacter braakii]|uniref:Lipoprotein n=2 Tax=Enterobacteriaceae TaxID=543 RepID=A0A1V8NRM8_CITBR|nr:hypothetical protein BZK42_26845 [Citrobacter braakii]
MDGKTDMKENKLSLVLLGCLFLCSCADNPPLPKTKIVDTREFRTDSGSVVTILTQNAINGNVIDDTDNSLNLVTKADNAKVMGLKILQFTAGLLGGGNTSVNGYSKDGLKGNYIDNVNNKTMEYLNPELDSLLNNINIPSGRISKITVEPFKFKLIYDGLDNDNYQFIYSTTISAGDFYHVCSSNSLISSEQIRPFSEWEKNNYELTQSMTRKIIKQCFENINSGEKDKLEKGLLSAKDD